MQFQFHAHLTLFRPHLQEKLQKKRRSRISREKSYCLHKGHSLHMCVCVCVHVHVHESICACISDTSIVKVFVIVMCGMDVVLTEFAIMKWPSVIPTQLHPPTIHTHFTLGFTLISPSTHVHPLSALQIRRPADGNCLPLKLARNM